MKTGVCLKNRLMINVLCVLKNRMFTDEKRVNMINFSIIVMITGFRCRKEAH